MRVDRHRDLDIAVADDLTDYVWRYAQVQQERDAGAAGLGVAALGVPALRDGPGALVGDEVVIDVVDVQGRGVGGEHRAGQAALADLAGPEGIVSLVARNAYALATPPAPDGNWAEALAAFTAERQVNGLGLDTRADTLESLTAMLAESGVERAAWYGVRMFTDSWPPGRPAEDDEGDVPAVELEASRRDPCRQISRLLHFADIRDSAA